MNPYSHRHQRANDTLFAIVLAAAAASTGYVGWANAGDAGAAASKPLMAQEAPAPLQLERVVITAPRSALLHAEAAAPLTLPCVVVTGKRSDLAAAGTARAAAADPNT
jgi:hypothetical protein